jgi:hypothetical protein
MRNTATVILCLLVVSGCATRDFVVNPTTVCRCNASIGTPCRASADRWTRAIQNQLEVDVSDFNRGEVISTKCESEGDNLFTNAWKPVDGSNHMLVGTFHHFNWNYDDDDDWNIHVIPDSAFAELITRVEASHPESADNHVRCGSPHCMEAEISPDKKFWNNPWFFAPGEHPNDADDNGFSLLEGRKMGFYGPWVVDANHDSKSEIHPASMIWWKEIWAIGGGSPSALFFLMLLQDNTGRFDDRNNFDCGGSAPPGWQPWTQSPVSGQFSVAFEADPAGPLVVFSVNEMFSRFVKTSQDVDARRDADDGTAHNLVFSGQTLVSVTEDQPKDNDLGVTFTNICLRPDGKLQGFVSIRSQVGGNDDIDEEGFHILYAARRLRSRPDVVAPVRPVLDGIVLRSEEVGDSVRWEDGHLTGDLRLSLSTTTDPVSDVELATDDRRVKLPFTQDARSGLVLLRGLPLTAARIHVTTASGKRSSLPVAALSLNPRIQFAKEGKGLKLKLSTRYAPVKGAGLSDRQSAFAKYINDALQKRDTKTLQALFHSDQPLATTWKLDATDVATGSSVYVGADIHRSAFGDETVRVQFPSASGIIELRALATVTDANGKSATVEQRVRSDGTR